MGKKSKRRGKKTVPTPTPTCIPCSGPQPPSRATESQPYPNPIENKNKLLQINNNRVFDGVVTEYLNHLLNFLHSYGFDTQRFARKLENSNTINQRSVEAIETLRYGAAKMGPKMTDEEALKFVTAVWPDRQDEYSTGNPHNIMCLISTTIKMIQVRLSCEASDLIERGSDEFDDDISKKLYTGLKTVTCLHPLHCLTSILKRLLSCL